MDDGDSPLLAAIKKGKGLKKVTEASPSESKSKADRDAEFFKQKKAEQDAQAAKKKRELERMDPEARAKLEKEEEEKRKHDQLKSKANQRLASNYARANPLSAGRGRGRGLNAHKVDTKPIKPPTTPPPPAPEGKKPDNDNDDSGGNDLMAQLKKGRQLKHAAPQAAPTPPTPPPPAPEVKKPDNDNDDSGGNDLMAQLKKGRQLKHAALPAAPAPPTPPPTVPPPAPEVKKPDDDNDDSDGNDLMAQLKKGRQLKHAAPPAAPTPPTPPPPVPPPAPEVKKPDDDNDDSGGNDLMAQLKKGRQLKHAAPLAAPTPPTPPPPAPEVKKPDDDNDDSGGNDLMAQLKKGQQLKHASATVTKAPLVPPPRPEISLPPKGPRPQSAGPHPPSISLPPRPPTSSAPPKINTPRPPSISLPPRAPALKASPQPPSRSTVAVPPRPPTPPVSTPRPPSISPPPRATASTTSSSNRPPEARGAPPSAPTKAPTAPRATAPPRPPAAPPSAPPRPPPAPPITTPPRPPTAPPSAPPRPPTAPPITTPPRPPISPPSAQSPRPPKVPAPKPQAAPPPLVVPPPPRAVPPPVSVPPKKATSAQSHESNKHSSVENTAGGLPNQNNASLKKTAVDSAKSSLLPPPPPPPPPPVSLPPPPPPSAATTTRISASARTMPESGIPPPPPPPGPPSGPPPPPPPLSAPKSTLTRQESTGLPRIEARSVDSPVEAARPPTSSLWSASPGRQSIGFKVPSIPSTRSEMAMQSKRMSSLRWVGLSVNDIQQMEDSFQGLDSGGSGEDAPAIIAETTLNKNKLLVWNNKRHQSGDWLERIETHGNSVLTKTSKWARRWFVIEMPDKMSPLENYDLLCYEDDKWDAKLLARQSLVGARVMARKLDINDFGVEYIIYLLPGDATTSQGRAKSHGKKKDKERPPGAIELRAPSKKAREQWIRSIEYVAQVASKREESTQYLLDAEEMQHERLNALVEAYAKSKELAADGADRAAELAYDDAALAVRQAQTLARIANGVFGAISVSAAAVKAAAEAVLKANKASSPLHTRWLIFAADNALDIAKESSLAAAGCCQKNTFLRIYLRASDQALFIAKTSADVASTCCAMTKSAQALRRLRLVEDAVAVAEKSYDLAVAASALSCAFLLMTLAVRTSLEKPKEEPTLAPKKKDEHSTVALPRTATPAHHGRGRGRGRHTRGRGRSASAHQRGGRSMLHHHGGRGRGLHRGRGGSGRSRTLGTMQKEEEKPIEWTSVAVVLEKGTFLHLESLDDESRLRITGTLHDEIAVGDVITSIHGADIDPIHDEHEFHFVLECIKHAPRPLDLGLSRPSRVPSEWLRPQPDKPGQRCSLVYDASHQSELSVTAPIEEKKEAIIDDTSNIKSSENKKKASIILPELEIFAERPMSDDLDSLNAECKDLRERIVYENKRSRRLTDCLGLGTLGSSRVARTDQIAALRRELLRSRENKQKAGNLLLNVLGALDEAHVAHVINSNQQRFLAAADDSASSWIAAIVSESVNNHIKAHRTTAEHNGRSKKDVGAVPSSRLHYKSPKSPITSRSQKQQHTSKTKANSRLSHQPAERRGGGSMYWH